MHPQSFEERDYVKTVVDVKLYVTKPNDLEANGLGYN